MAPFTGIGLASPTIVSDLFGVSSASSPASSSSTAASITSTGWSVESQTPPSTQLTSASSTSSPSARPRVEAVTSGTSFFRNKPVVIGVFAGAAVLLLLLAFFITCLVRCRHRRQQRQRQQQLDREIDASFCETMQHAAEEWRGAGRPSLNPRGASASTLRKVLSVTSESSGSHEMYYTQPPLPVHPQHQPDFYSYDPRFRACYACAGRESLAVMRLAVGVVVAAPQVQIVQPPRALQARYDYDYDNKKSHLVPQPAEVHPQPLPALYLSHYAVSPLHAHAQATFTPSMAGLTSPTEMPITPTPFPNPFDQQQDQHQYQLQQPTQEQEWAQGQMLQATSTSTSMAVSPISPLTNPYDGIDE
ncbi:hypothetical protein B0H14DRAFT_2733159 [Mycena olivaceomarginata]|nr:hypothetical protein B0H14DRAFT_2733159 [Mycena olivaceomarginata]